MRTIDETSRQFLKREIFNYLSDHPNRIQLGLSNVEDLSLSIGKLLIWISGELDGNDASKRVALGSTASSIQNLGEQFREVGLQMMELKPHNTRKEITLEALASRLSALEAKGQL